MIKTSENSHQSHFLLGPSFRESYEPPCQKFEKGLHPSKNESSKKKIQLQGKVNLLAIHKWYFKTTVGNLTNLP